MKINGRVAPGYNEDLRKALWTRLNSLFFSLYSTIIIINNTLPSNLSFATASSMCLWLYGWWRSFLHFPSAVSSCPTAKVIVTTRAGWPLYTIERGSCTWMKWRPFFVALDFCLLCYLFTAAADPPLGAIPPIELSSSLSPFTRLCCKRSECWLRLIVISTCSRRSSSSSVFIPLYLCSTCRDFVLL